LVEIGHQVWKVVQIGNLYLDGDRFPPKLNNFENELFFHRGYPRTLVFLFVQSLDFIQVKLLNSVLMVLNLLGQLVLVVLADAFGQERFELQKAALDTFDDLLAGQDEAQLLVEDLATMAESIELEVERRLYEILVDGSQPLWQIQKIKLETDEVFCPLRKVNAHHRFFCRHGLLVLLLVRGLLVKVAHARLT